MFTIYQFLLVVPNHPVKILFANQTNLNIFQIQGKNSPIQGRKTKLNHMQRSYLESEIDCCADVKSSIDIRFEMRHEILSRVLLHINDEDIYLHFFRQLVDLDHGVKGCPNMTHDSLENFKVIPFENHNPQKI